MSEGLARRLIFWVFEYSAKRCAVVHVSVLISEIQRKTLLLAFGQLYRILADMQEIRIRSVKVSVLGSLTNRNF